MIDTRRWHGNIGATHLVVALFALAFVCSSGIWATGSTASANEEPDASVTAVPGECFVVSIPNTAEKLLVPIRIPGPDTGGFYFVAVAWKGAALGMFGPGLSWPVYVCQEADGSWVGGPVLSLGGVSFSGGHGVNGDGWPDYIFRGGGSAGNSWSIVDDSDAERDPEYWTFMLDNSASDSEVFFLVKVYICVLGQNVSTLP